MQKTFHGDLKKYIDEYVHMVYDATESFPKSELFGVTSQFRRSSLSVMLNYVEGYARGRTTYIRSFLEIAYGSLKESEYLIDFCFKRKYIGKNEEEKLSKLASTIGGMLYGILSKLK